ncbi:MULTISPECIES: globin-coupled sensor protein [unclassified Lysinibacillus]|uniref:globin-coupled sensor protein n=1 Tax=unclassified Lysinibacillus TaxID=2636778 RepID=UPI002555D565|nr:MULTISPECIES: globin-coupled sensor protein [unclassified Lysinibacillus]MDM5246641.1 globin-coupled sensor protein [Lysinibacillus sp. G4S2]
MFWKNKNKQIDHAFILLDSNIKMNIQNGSEIEKQIKMIHFSIEELQVLKNLQPFIVEKIDDIVDYFYKSLALEDSLLRLITNNSSVDALKKTLKLHILDMFSGIIDDEYFIKRARIAQMHVKIGLQTKWYLSAFQNLFITVIEIIEKNLSEKELYYSSVKALSKLFNLEQQIVLEEYDKEISRIKEKSNKQVETTKNQVVNSTENLAAISEQTNASFQELHILCTEMIEIVNTGKELSTLAEERAENGKLQISKQNSNMKKVHEAVQIISIDIDELLKITKEVQGIIDIVTKIADQTNLLSLNAAIEAARAGENGRGFAVVAEEVKKLSEVTKKSVLNVAHLVLSTVSNVEKLSTSLDMINKSVHDEHQIMKQTNIFFEQILNSMKETQEHNKHLQDELEIFIGVVNELGKSFEEVTLSADGLASFANELNN